MPDIKVSTTSTDFGLLPPDLSQFGGWIGQYLPASQTIYQDQSNTVTGFLSMANALNAYIAKNGVGALNYSGVTDAQVTVGPYSVNLHGIFFGAFSEITSLSITNTVTGEKVTGIGNMTYAGLPLSSPFSLGSTLSLIIDTVPNTLAHGSTWSGVVALDVMWNNTTWDGNVTGYTHSVSDPDNDKSYQTTITEAPATISFATNTTVSPGSAGKFSLAVPTVTGIESPVCTS